MKFGRNDSFLYVEIALEILNMGLTSIFSYDVYSLPQNSMNIHIRESLLPPIPITALAISRTIINEN